MYLNLHFIKIDSSDDIQIVSCLHILRSLKLDMNRYEGLFKYYFILNSLLPRIDIEIDKYLAQNFIVINF